MSLIKKQSTRSLQLSIGTEFYALSKIGDYTFVDCLVAFRDNTKMCATVITPQKTPWGEEKMPVCAKHAPYISMTKDGRPITLDEAYYISGILNTEIIREYIFASNDSRSVSIDLPIKIPEFNARNEDMSAIAKLSKEAHELAKERKNTKQRSEEIEKYYLKICE